MANNLQKIVQNYPTTSGFTSKFSGFNHNFRRSKCHFQWQIWQVSLLDFPWVLDYILATRFNCSLRQIRHAVCSIAGTLEMGKPWWGPLGQG